MHVAHAYMAQPTLMACHMQPKVLVCDQCIVIIFVFWGSNLIQSLLNIICVL